MEYVIVILLFIILGTQIYLRPFEIKHIKYIFNFSIALLVAYLSYISFSQYNLWTSGSNLGRYLLPPYNTFSYFIFYILSRIWAKYLISFLFGILFFFLLQRYNKRKESSIFYEEEYYLSAISLFLVGWPGIVFYLILLILIFSMSSIIATIIKGKSFRLSTYYFWIPISIFVIILSSIFLNNTSIWLLLKI